MDLIDILTWPSVKLAAAMALTFGAAFVALAFGLPS